ncbi:MAG TPA: hypothetical protein VFC03_23880 [Acidimicrobiales bacterium]|nr:hypothetical protein [Acidimicrobiales bacterium]
MPARTMRRRARETAIRISTAPTAEASPSTDSTTPSGNPPSAGGSSAVPVVAAVARHPDHQVQHGRREQEVRRLSHPAHPTSRLEEA